MLFLAIAISLLVSSFAGGFRNVCDLSPGSFDKYASCVEEGNSKLSEWVSSIAKCSGLSMGDFFKVGCDRNTSAEAREKLFKCQEQAAKDNPFDGVDEMKEVEILLKRCMGEE